MRCGGGVFHSNAAHRGDAPAPTRPRKGRAIAYGIFESFPPLGLWPIWFPDRHSRNRIENKTESKLVRRLCLEQRRWPQQTTASSRISICDTPARKGEGSGVGVLRALFSTLTPLPNPPPQGGR